jgi:hypothetical protein
MYYNDSEQRQPTRLSSLFLVAPTTITWKILNLKILIYIDIQLHFQSNPRNWKLRAHCWWWCGRWPEQWAHYESQMKTFPWIESPLRCREMPRNAITPHASKCANFESTYLMPMILWSKTFRVHCKVVVKIFAALYLLGKWSLFRYSCNLFPNYVGALQNIYKTLYILERCQHLGKQCQSIAGNGGLADG